MISHFYDRNVYAQLNSSYMSSNYISSKSTSYNCVTLIWPINISHESNVALFSYLEKKWNKYKLFSIGEPFNVWKLSIVNISLVTLVLVKLKLWFPLSFPKSILNWFFYSSWRFIVCFCSRLIRRHRRGSAAYRIRKPLHHFIFRIYWHADIVT